MTAFRVNGLCVWSYGLWVEVPDIAVTATQDSQLVTRNPLTSYALPAALSPLPGNCYSGQPALQSPNMKKGMRCALGIDFGTNSVRALIGGARRRGGNRLGGRQLPLRP